MSDDKPLHVWRLENGNLLRFVRQSSLFADYQEYSPYADLAVATHREVPLGAKKLTVNHRLASVEADLDTAELNLRNHINHIATLNARIKDVQELIDGWLATHGPGTQVEKVFGRQTVSVAFLHDRISELLAGTAEADARLERNPHTLEKLYAAEAQTTVEVEL